MNINGQIDGKLRLRGLKMRRPLRGLTSLLILRFRERG